MVEVERRVRFAESTAVAPICEAPVDSDLLSQCMTFKDAQGHAQLLCILNGQSTSFKISCQDDGTCEIAKRKIRFIGQNFFMQIQEICITSDTSKLHRLCSLLQREITEGRAIFEQTTKTGQRHAIASPTVAKLLKSGGMALKSTKGKAITYNQINSAGSSFFKIVANSFGSSIQGVLTFHEQFIKNNTPVEKTSPEGIRIEQEHKIAAKTQNSRSFWEYVKDAFYRLFESNDSALKAQENHYIFERAQNAQRLAVEDERKSREIDDRRFEARRDERKRDDARYDVQRLETKASQAKQDARIFGG